MQLKISSPERNMYEGHILQITLPTESWDIDITDSQTPMVTALKPGIVKIIPQTEQMQVIAISIGKGMAFVDGKVVRVVTSTVTLSPEESEENLKTMKNELEEKIKELRKKWSIEEIEKSLIKLEKINADLKLERIKNLP